MPERVEVPLVVRYEKAMREISKLEDKSDKSISALRRIRTQTGKVCDDYAECRHHACYSSHAAWTIADEVLSLIDSTGAEITANTITGDRITADVE